MADGCATVSLESVPICTASKFFSRWSGKVRAVHIHEITEARIYGVDNGFGSSRRFVP